MKKLLMITTILCLCACDSNAKEEIVIIKGTEMNCTYTSRNQDLRNPLRSLVRCENSEVLCYVMSSRWGNGSDGQSIVCKFKGE